MNRRRFIRQSAWLTSGAALFPWVLTGCKPTAYFDESINGEVIIIGAGAAGLYAGELLIRQGAQVKILEASSRWGGRLRSVPEATGTAAAAEKKRIHGEFSILFDVVKRAGIPLAPPPLQEMFYFNGRLNTTAEAMENTFFLEMLQGVASFETYESADISALEYYDALGLSENTTHIFNVLTGQVNGTSADRISGIGLRKQHELRSSGPSDFEVTTDDLERALSNLLSSALNAIIFDSTVIAVDYSTNKISVTTADGTAHTCDKLLITAPLQVLQSGSISFAPTLPQAQVTAYNSIGIDHSYTASLKAENIVWPEGTTRLYGPGSMQRYDVNNEGWIYAEASGKQADDISAIFGEPASVIANDLRNILGDDSLVFTEITVHHWLGNRSYDKPGTANARSVIAQPIAGKLFFAGEATHTGGHHGTLHGAMETGLRAATEIITALQS
jgi:monoamine oxidase